MTMKAGIGAVRPQAGDPGATRKARSRKDPPLEGAWPCDSLISDFWLQDQRE